MLSEDVIVLCSSPNPSPPLPPPHEQQLESMKPPPHKKPRLSPFPPQEQPPLMVPPPTMPPPSFPPMLPPRPRSIFYKTRLCSRYAAFGFCPNGAACTFAHGPAELLPPPPNWQENAIAKPQRTGICRKFAAGEDCPKGERCIFLHVRGDGPAATNVSGLHRAQGSGRFGNVAECYEWNQSTPRFWNSRPCNNGETSSRHSGEEMFNFARGPAELEKPPLSVQFDMANSRSAPRSTLPTSAYNLTSAGSGSVSSDTTQKGFKNLERIKKLNRIYADWIE